MIRTLEIRNFRCFKDLYLRDLKRFNLIVGESGSGKTALLESIFLAGSANPEVWMRLRQWRGSSALFRLSGTRSSYESLFRDIFYNFDKRRAARIEFSDDEQNVRSIKISYPSQEKYSLKPSTDQSDSQQENTLTFDPIVFSWKSKGKEQKARVDVKDGKVIFRGFSNVYPIWFSSPLINEGQIVAQAFSELNLKKKTGPLVSAITRLYPTIEDMGVESIAGDLALCVSTTSLSERIPIGVMSSGVTRFLAIMVAIAANPGGAVLVDEIESGFYYATLPAILDAIISFCQEQNVQILATTHSYEFMQTLMPLARERENEFSFFRAERSNGQYTVKALEDFPSAIESNFEVR